MAHTRDNRYNSSPSPRVRPIALANSNTNGATWAGKSRKTSAGEHWMRRIVDEDDGDEGSSEVDVEGVTRDIGKMRRESEGAGNGKWDAEFDFTARSMEISESPRLKTRGIPSRIEEIMDQERSIAEDDDDEEDGAGRDAAEDVLRVLERPRRATEGLASKREEPNLPEPPNTEEKKASIRARSMDRRNALRRELQERREQRRLATSYESEGNNAPEPRQEGAIRNRPRTEQRSQSDDLPRRDAVARDFRDSKENDLPQGESQKPMSRLEKRFQRDDGLNAIQRARQNRLRNDHNQGIQERERARSRPRLMEQDDVIDDAEAQQHDKTILEEEGERIPGTPITIFSGNERRLTEGNAKNEDSLQILRNLSKAMKTETAGSQKTSPGRSEGRQEIIPETRNTRERASSSYEPEIKSERNRESERERETVRPPPTPPPSAPIDPLLLPTPRVTGAFIETPAPPRTRIEKPIHQDEDTNSSSSRTSIKQEPLSPRLPSTQSKPSRPLPKNSAPILSAIDDLRRIEKEAQIDDTTLDRDISLILKAQAESGTSSTPPLLPELNLDFDEKGNPLSKKEKERRLEELAFDRMSKSLRHTTSSIRDARHGIERLEKRVSSSSSTRPLGRFKLEEDEQLRKNAINGIPPLIPNRYLLLPVPHLRHPQTKKLTLLGLLLSIFTAWFVLESAMCYRFCHPRYASRSDWLPSDPFWPWALPTKVDQWTGGVVGRGVEGLGEWWREGEGGKGEDVVLTWRERVALGREQAGLGEEEEREVRKGWRGWGGWSAGRGSGGGYKSGSGGVVFDGGWDGDEILG
ncbi:decorin binding domain-containing protein [Rutstroemia sp. NJR-2017a BVV2]|nr:decorin binding domain-containing protein [Rutstroemia sp. NJR-2017a BVV2]